MDIFQSEVQQAQTTYIIVYRAQLFEAFLKAPTTRQAIYKHSYEPVVQGYMQ